MSTSLAMKLTALLAILGLTALTSHANAQADTARHRAVYDQINSAEDSYKRVTAKAQIEEESFSLVGWLDDGEVKKIVATSSGDGDGTEEYYLEKGQPLFVYSVYSKGGEGSKKRERVEERLYFKDGAVFKWLTTEKNAPVFHGEDYAAMTDRLTNNCEAFVRALKKGGNANKGQAALRTAEGAFAGIDQGDYAHWNMRTKDGEASYFILRPDASVEKVLENPEAYIGKRCRITWKSSMEDIPESGGKMKVDQVLSVEWLGRK